MPRRWGVADVRAALSAPPDRFWPTGLIHHGGRILLVVLVALAAHLLFPLSPVPDIPVLEKGMVTERDIVAQVSFPIYKSGQDLGRERAEAAASVPPIFEYDAGAPDTLLARGRAFFAAVDAALAQHGGPAMRLGALSQLLASYRLPASADVLRLLTTERTRRDLARALEETAREDVPAGVAALADLQATGAASQIRLRRYGRELLVAREAVHPTAWVYDRAALRLPMDAPPGAAELERLLLIRLLRPSVRLNENATEQARERARAAVSPVAGQVLRGEKVVGAHEQVGDEELQRLHSYRDELARLGRLEGGRAGRLRATGAILVDIITLLVFGLAVVFYRPRIYREFRHVLLLGLFVLGLLAVCAIVDRVHAPVELIPIAIPVLLVASLWDGQMALVLGLVLAVLLAGQGPFVGITPLFSMIAGGAAAALGLRVVRQRAQTWVVIMLVAAAYAATAIALGLLRSRPAGDILESCMWGLINATGSALVAMGLLPLVEVFTRITTDQTLLELGDMNRPLLRRLALETPGTYAHSVSVANLAEAAARAVDGNPLLARVGTYYHDVGKLAKPQYFIENQPQGRNPHDRLKPSTSAAIVRGHVAEGMRLAEQYRLPESIRAFIREHHGTQPIGFFLDQARELNPGAEPNPTDYSYPGPRPRSKETAILMLADGVESAARVLHDPTPERIKALVDRIVDGKMAQGQLDEAPLTLGELSRVKEELTKVLSGMYHHRIDYPAMREPAPAEAQATTLAPAASPAPVPVPPVATSPASAAMPAATPSPPAVPAPATGGKGTP